jgi:hypothetical protein
MTRGVNLEDTNSACAFVHLQGSAAEANASIEKAKQLSMDITSVLYSFTNTQAVFADIRWHLLRPVMRLLLWLVPEHLPTPVTVSASTVTVQPPVRGTAADEQSTAPTQCDEGWREEAAITFAREVATVSLLQLQVLNQILGAPMSQPVPVMLLTIMSWRTCRLHLLKLCWTWAYTRCAKMSAYATAPGIGALKVQGYWRSA